MTDETDTLTGYLFFVLRECLMKQKALRLARFGV